ncbi:hypothetical protein AAC387_Pa05g0002 [Persea americana]
MQGGWDALGLEDTYEAPRRAFRILGIDKTADTSPATCPLIAETLASQSSKAKGLFYALIVNSILRCSIDARAFEGFGSKLQSVLKDARSLLDCYYSIGGLVLIKVAFGSLEWFYAGMEWRVE